MGWGVLGHGGGGVWWVLKYTGRGRVVHEGVCHRVGEMGWGGVGMIEGGWGGSGAGNWWV